MSGSETGFLSSLASKKFSIPEPSLSGGGGDLN